jgi:uncharacterized protein YecE (DUF72 family)
MSSTHTGGAIRIGISGWRYDGWRGEFYPPGLPQRAEMEYACSRFPSVEINGTFYSLQRKAYFQTWHDATADDFVFAIKGSRFLTHMKQLNDPEPALANFFGQGLLVLGDKLGPILWQFSQRFRFREDRFRPFLELLPKDHAAAARLARKHDHRTRDPATEPRTDAPIRHAIEIRHESFLVPAFVDLLREHGAALVVSDNPGVYPMVEEPTADFMYVRLHGSERMYYGSYDDPVLDEWADRIRKWSRGQEPEDAERITDRAPPRARARDVYLYFDNDEKTKAPFDARRLMDRLDLAEGYPEPGSREAWPA